VSIVAAHSQRLLAIAGSSLQRLHSTVATVAAAVAPLAARAEITERTRDQLPARTRGGLTDFGPAPAAICGELCDGMSRRVIERRLLTLSDVRVRTVTA
jgi:hypothetical protein